jgi:hypothetical protein
MKTKYVFLLSFAFWLLSYPLFPQTGGFNYQAVVRNAAGTILPNQNVGFKFSILQGSSTGTLVYSETFNLNTSSQGSVDLVIGTGTVVSGNFSSINWSTGPYYLKAEIDPTGGTSYSLAETKQIQSVPYANAISARKLTIKGNSVQNPEDTLFEVKRSDGQVMFGVYNEGVRMYVLDEPGKGAKGGFAVGGFDPRKGLTHDYLWVTPDSVRIYIENLPPKGAKGGFAVGGFNPQKQDEPFNLMKLTRENYFIGHEAGIGIEGGINNVAIGYQSARSLQDGNFNVFLGNKAGYNQTDGTGNVFIGDQSGYSNTTGFFNIFIGRNAGYNNEGAAFNTFIGHEAGLKNKTGERNLYLGFYAGEQNTSGTQNTYVGYESARNQTSGNNNTYVGAYTGLNNTSGTGNIFLGAAAGSNETGSNKLYIDNMGSDTSNVLIYGDMLTDNLRFNANLGIYKFADPLVALDVGGKIQAIDIVGTSDIRFKSNIEEVSDALTTIMELRGVRFNWKANEYPQKHFPSGKQYGVIAQEVEQVVPDIVFTGTQGYKSVSYEQITPLLIEAIKEQQTIIRSLEKRIEELESQIKK